MCPQSHAHPANEESDAEFGPTVTDGGSDRCVTVMKRILSITGNNRGACRRWSEPRLRFSPFRVDPAAKRYFELGKF